MKLNAELISQGFILSNVDINDLTEYIKIKKICYQKYVDEYYGAWVDDLQIKDFNKMMNETCFKKILLNNQTVGFLAYNEQKDEINGVSIQMIDIARNKGIGSFYLKYIVELSEKTGKPVFLRVFKSNPAQNLYKRFGFEIYDENSSHFFMKYESK